MSKLAEQKALEAYPSTDRDPNGIFVQVRREDYAKGYDQAMRDFLEKAEKFFSEMYETWDKPGLGKKTIEQFKNYMQNEM